MVHNISSKKYFPSVEVTQLSGGSIQSLNSNYYYMKIVPASSGDFQYYPKIKRDFQDNFFFAGSANSGDDTVFVKITPDGVVTAKKYDQSIYPYINTDFYVDKANQYIYGVGYTTNGTKVVGILLRLDTNLVIQSQRTFTCSSISDRYTSPQSIVGRGQTIYIASSQPINDATYAKTHLTQFTAGTTANWSRSSYDYGSIYNYQPSAGIDDSNSGYATFYKNTNGACCLMKYDSSGTFQWHRQFIPNAGGAAFNYPKLVVHGSTGNSYFSTNIQTSGIARLVLVKYNSSGSLLWAKRINRSSGTQENINFEVNKSIILDSNENIFYSFIGYDTNNSISASTVAKYDSSGNLKWVRSFQKIQKGTTSDSLQSLGYQHHSLEVDSSDNLYLCAGETTTKTPNGVHILKYPNDGSLLGEFNTTNGDIVIIRDVTSLYTAADFTDYTESNLSGSTDNTNATLSTPTSTETSPTYTKDKTNYLR